MKLDQDPIPLLRPARLSGKEVEPARYSDERILDLVGVVGRRGPAFVRRKLSEPTPDNPTSMMPNSGLSPTGIEALLAYLATLEQSPDYGGR